MNFRHPLIVVSVSAIIITALAVSSILAGYSADQFRSEKRAQVLEMRDAAKSLVSTVNQALMKSVVNVYEHELATPDSAAPLEASEFAAIGAFAQDSAGGWTEDFFISRTPQIERDWFVRIEKQIALAGVRPGELTWARLTNEAEPVLFGVMTQVQVKSGENFKTKIIVGVSSQALLAPLLAFSKGDSTQIFTIDRDGYTFSYPEAQYVGAKIDAHPVVQAMLSDDQASSLVRTTVADLHNLEGAPILGSGDWVPDSNLAVIVTAPRVSMQNLLARYFTHALIVILALVGLLIAGLSYLLARDGRERHALLKNLELLKKPTDSEVMPAAPPTPGMTLQSTTQLNLKEIVRAMADFVRMPLTAALGQLQMVERQDSLTQVKGTVESTGNEVRRVRDFIEAICKEVQVPELEREVVEVLPVLNQVMASHKGLLTKYDITLEEGVSADFAIRGDFERVRSSIHSLVLAAIEFASQAPLEDRRLVIHVEKLAGLGQIQIEAHGRDLTSEAKRNFFAPFKYKLQAGTQYGLDLAVAQSRIEEMQGEVFVENIDGQGLRIVTRFATATTPAFHLRNENVGLDV
jgi:signal transduction histidine kinase